MNTLKRIHGLLLKRAGMIAAILWGGTAIILGQQTTPLPSPSGNLPRTPEQLSLAEAKRLALERNWDLLAAKSDVDQATAARIIAHEFPNPTFSWSTMKIPVNSQPASTIQGNNLWSRSYDTIASFNQLFEIGGKRRNRQLSAEQGYQAMQARFADARRVLDLAVSKAYIAVVQADLNAQTLRDSAASLRREAEIAAVRLEAGDIATADKSQIDIQASRFELDAVTAETNALQQRITLENLIGSPQPTGQWTATDPIESLLAPSLEVHQERGIPQRPDLIAAEALLKKSEAEVRLQKAFRIPDPSVMVMYEHEPPDANQTIGVGLSFPLPLWNRNRGAIRAAEASRNQAAVQASKVRGQIAADIATAQAAYREAMARYDHYRQDIRPKSAQVLKTISFAYEKGGASLLDLLSAQRNDNEVRLATVQAAADAAAAQAALRAALLSGGSTLNQSLTSPIRK